MISASGTEKAMISFGNDHVHRNPPVASYSDANISMDRLIPGMPDYSRKMWQDTSEPLFIQPLSHGLSQDYHICTADERQSLWAELGDPKVIKSPQTPDLNNVVGDNLVLRDRDYPVSNHAATSLDSQR